MSDLTRLEAAAAGLDSFPTEEETADHIGRLDKVIRTLQGHRRSIMSEVPGPLNGKDYRIVSENVCERSYNTPRLLDDFDRSGASIWDLIEQDVIRVSWQWTKMRNLAIRQDIGLRIAGHELDPAAGEADHVGEHWKTRLSVESMLEDQ